MKKMKLFFTAAVMLAFSVAALAQNITVKGTVKDAAGEPIVGANVILVGSNTVYALTDISGAFTLSVPRNGSLDVSCLGYSTRVVPVDGQTTLEIILQDDTTVLDETIVVAYGTATKSSFTGSAAVVDAESIEKKIATSVTSALAGTTPGVQVTSASGDPSGGTPPSASAVSVPSALPTPRCTLWTVFLTMVPSPTSTRRTSSPCPC